MVNPQEETISRDTFIARMEGYRKSTLRLDCVGAVVLIIVLIGILCFAIVFDELVSAWGQAITIFGMLGLFAAGIPVSRYIHGHKRQERAGILCVFCRYPFLQIEAEDILKTRRCMRCEQVVISTDPGSDASAID